MNYKIINKESEIDIFEGTNKVKTLKIKDFATYEDMQKEAERLCVFWDKLDQKYDRNIHYSQEQLNNWLDWQPHTLEELQKIADSHINLDLVTVNENSVLFLHQHFNVDYKNEQNVFVYHKNANGKWQRKN